MLLNLMERLTIINLFPMKEESNIATVRIIREIKQKLAPSAEEYTTFGIKKGEDGSIRWDSNDSVEVDITSAEKGFLSERFDDISKSDKFKESYLDIYDRLRAREDI